VTAEGIRGAKMKVSVFWDVKPCSLTDRHQHFGGPLRLRGKIKIDFTSGIIFVVFISSVIFIDFTFSKILKICGP